MVLIMHVKVNFEVKKKFFNYLLLLKWFYSELMKILF